MLPEILIQQLSNIRSLDGKRAGIQGYIIIIIIMFNTSKAPFYMYINISSKALGDTQVSGDGAVYPSWKF